ncbi:Serine aminopeptidase, S33 [Nitrosospira sp. Nsp14]|uniref:alpha/beta hydrolase n=1 Tax=Nitrosospira sp. Nsp14 TaxID=1855333 RepID=UPI0008E04572|nr:alpha/beta fold hydrolase [Nitrosospira sp. Nsp14]SFH28870.1 Serine aminopeptidase, S33 [Nitrosospira sp. Nsp14]
MPRWILIAFFAMLSGIAAVLLAALAVGELLSGAAPTPVSTLSLSLGADFPVESVRVPRHDNSRDEDASVHAWLVRGEPGAGVILLVHSIRSNRVEMLSRARFLNEHGYGVLLIDLQAHGETPGERITFGVRESEDVQAAVNYLRNAFPRERMGAIGVSLGAAAIVLAKTPLRLDAVVLESLHPTIEEAVQNRMKLHVGEAGSILSPLLLWQLSFRLGIPVTELNPIGHIGNLNAPVLLVSGSIDQHTRMAETERLFAAAREPKEIWIVPGGGHFNMHAYAGREYERRIIDFLAWHLRERNAAH